MSVSISLKEIRHGVKKPENIWFHVFYYFSSYIVWLSIRLGITPNQLTVTGFALNLTGFVFFLSSQSGPTQIFITAAIFFTAHLFDCADGHLAHVGNLRSERGFWLDSTFDIFKLAFVTTCFIKIIMAPTLPSCVLCGMLRIIALAAAGGLLVDYAVSLHAEKYAKIGDYYLSTQISSISAAHSIFVRFPLSVIREYANYLVIFVIFGVRHNIAVVLFALFGLCHFILALARIVRIARSI
jgi:phosphatidylglycerophosphate synthase